MDDSYKTAMTLREKHKQFASINHGPDAHGESTPPPRLGSVRKGGQPSGGRRSRGRGPGSNNPSRNLKSTNSSAPSPKESTE